MIFPERYVWLYAVAASFFELSPDFATLNWFVFLNKILISNRYLDNLVGVIDWLVEFTWKLNIVYIQIKTKHIYI